MSKIAVADTIGLNFGRLHMGGLQWNVSRSFVAFSGQSRVEGNAFGYTCKFYPLTAANVCLRQSGDNLLQTFY